VRKSNIRRISPTETTVAGDQQPVNNGKTFGGEPVRYDSARSNMLDLASETARELAPYQGYPQPADRRPGMSLEEAHGQPHSASPALSALPLTTLPAPGLTETDSPLIPPTWGGR
jgi:hypothetical protein